MPWGSCTFVKQFRLKNHAILQILKVEVTGKSILLQWISIKVGWVVFKESSLLLPTHWEADWLVGHDEAVIGA